jgi:nicotinate (nicotinamide) nucleotide adenylyltransferase
MKIGLFFGSFNPIHAGHLIIANYMATYTGLNQVWLVVSPHNPLKEKESLVHTYDRLEMVRLAIDDTENLRVPEEYKNRLEEKYRRHLSWMSDRDPLQRATQGFRSAIQFMNATDNTQLIDTFWRKTHELDSIRNERIMDILPELQALK